MSGVRSTAGIRRLLPGLLAATLLPAAAFGALVVAVPGAGASPLPGAAALDTSPPTPPTPPTTPTTPGTSPFPPGAPGSLTASAVTTGSVTLTWTAATPGCCAVTAYDITYTQAFNDIVWSTQVGNVTTATVTANISRAKQYSFYVSARDSMGRRSPASNSVQVVTPNTDTGPDTTPPSRPGGLELAGQGATTAQLAWTAATDDVGVIGYDVYRFDGLYISTLLATVTGTGAGVPLGPGRNLFYVRARDAAGNVSIATNLLTVQGATNPPVTPGLCLVTYTNQAQWSGGFVAAVTIRNTSPSTAVDGWTLTFAFPGDQRVTSAWGTRAVQTNAVVTAQNADWNRSVPPGGSVSFGMQGAWSVSNAAPTAFALNGTGCVVGS
ncbi:cellulose binding domain-containing protein [Phytohabitans sp. ZYX-F-186]|uniref:Cellulose binding domain-containing protein n=1 Tax=Phytohabitans maris TaxID=3071409 RepID=A0ABU0ZF26_9ACTN|nr:cellulose binding domain-containing protein [Phytohabitans sp. ZYX-F-186]MDQ7904952.1 cellulose binding domain-containing protein [Phytohabitans sp. ZYX-F-186]